MSLLRLLLLRRRIDPLLLAAGFASVGLMATPAKIVFVFFAAAGFYLALLRPRSRRRFVPFFSALVAAYALWAVGLALLRGEGIDGNRQLGYSAVQFASVFLPLGLSIVARPIDAMVAGCRVGLVLLVLLTGAEYLWTGERVGLGGNEAILGFLAAAIGLAARIDLQSPLAFLPNGRWWTYLALLPVLLSQTRAGWFVFALVVVMDLWWLLRRRSGAGPLPRSVVAGAALALAVAAVPATAIIGERVGRAVGEIEAYGETGTAVGSVDVRLAMIAASLELVAEHPLAGVGSTDRMERVAERSPASAERILLFEHLHNVFLDEAVSHGLVGLALLFSVFAAFLLAVFRLSGEPIVRETAALMVFLVFSYGLFHGVLLNEWMIVAVFGFMATLLAGLDPLSPGRRRSIGASP